jgi:hypothetical protein
MRSTYCSITPTTVRTVAHQALATALPWRPYGTRVSVDALLRVILLTAALGSSVWAVVRRCAFGFSHETARRALDANLADLGSLADGLVDALHGFVPRAFRRRPKEIAIDRHDVPYYGRWPAPGVLGGAPKAGTKHFHSYATAVAVHRGQRWCLGLVPLVTNDPTTAVLALLAQLQARAIPIRALIMDRGYCSGHVILALQERNVPFVVGMSRKGGRWDYLWALPSGQVVYHQWTTERGGRPVRVAMVRVGRRIRGRWHREVYAFHGCGPRQAVNRWARARYYRQRMQRRFGIETSYRQLNQGKATTTTTDLRRRLLGVGVALLLRQVWVWVQRVRAGARTNWHRWRPAEALRLRVLLEWLAPIPFN